MKKVKIEDMNVRVTYSSNKINKDNLYRIFYAIIDREMKKDKTIEEGEKVEKECLSNES
ncbi:hypothetical protein Q3258_16835 [Clostridioides difficile]